MRTARPRLLVAAASVAALFAGACAPVDETTTQPSPTTTQTTGSATNTPQPQECAKEQLNLLEPGQLTIATSSPAFEPWVVDDEPSNGKGFESAVAYAVADRLGFASDEVEWVREPFNKSYQPGAKDFDFDINQISITPKREEAVDFSAGYYDASQAVVVLRDSAYADATSLADLRDARLGAQVGTTSLLAIEEGVAPSRDPYIYDDTNNAKTALDNGQVDGIVVDLPTAFYITAVEIPQGLIIGQFQPGSSETEQFGLLFEEGNPLVDCVNDALADLRSSGELERIERRWLSQVVDVPELS